MQPSEGVSCQMMKFLLPVLLALLLFSCQSAKYGDEFPKGCYPHDLIVEVDAKSMVLKWQKKCKRAISGYNIYISETPLAAKYAGKQLPKDIRPLNLEPFPGDTNPDDGIEVYKAEGLKDGQKYYVSVRILMPDGKESRPTSEIMAVCGGRGEIELSIRYKSNQDGFSFIENSFVRADNEQNDLYYYFKDGEDYIASPHKLNGFLRKNSLQLLPLKGEPSEIKTRIKEIKPNSGSDRLAVAAGNWIRLYTPEGASALVRVLGFSGDGDNRKIRLYYAYLPLKDEMLF